MLALELIAKTGTPKTHIAGMIFLILSLLVLPAPALPVSGASNSMTTPAEGWQNTIALTTRGGVLYTIEKSGALYATNLATGKWSQVGNPEFARTRYLFADDFSLYTIESDGSLYRVSPSNGAWSRVGQAGAWKATIALVVLNGYLYSVESGGGLYRTDLSSGKWVQVGNPEFARTRFMFADGQSLYTIERDGSLYRVSPSKGAWAQIGRGGAWANTMVATMQNGRIYTVERNGVLYETDPGTGGWRQIGKAEFGKTQFLFGDGDSLFSIDRGSLYRINPTSGSWVLVAR